jgi:hypothetical protein
VPQGAQRGHASSSLSHTCESKIHQAMTSSTTYAEPVIRGQNTTDAMGLLASRSPGANRGSALSCKVQPVQRNQRAWYTRVVVKLATFIAYQLI